MKKMINHSFATVKKALFRLGYDEIKNSNFKRCRFHCILNGRRGLTEILMHLDYPRAPWDSRHVGVDNDTRLNEEFKRISSECINYLKENKEKGEVNGSRVV